MEDTIVYRSDVPDRSDAILGELYALFQDKYGNLPYDIESKIKDLVNAYCDNRTVVPYSVRRPYNITREMTPEQQTAIFRAKEKPKYEAMMAARRGGTRKRSSRYRRRR